MKTSLVAAVLVAVQGFTSAAMAQNQSRMNVDLAPRKRVSVEILAAPLLLKGGGVAVGYNVTRKLNTSLFFEQYALDTDSSEKSASLFFRVKSEVRAFGLRADFFPLASVDQGGWYVGGSVTQTDVKSDITSFFFGDGSAKDSKTGVRGQTGYLFRGGLLRKANMMIKLGLGHGIGGEVATQRINGEAKTELRSGLMFDLNVGMMF